MKKAIEDAGGTYIRADANLKMEQQLTDIDQMIGKGAKVLVDPGPGHQADPAGDRQGQGSEHPGHRL